MTSAEAQNLPKTPEGSPRDALAEPTFRRIYAASFVSNIGRWMQFAALGVLGQKLTGSPQFLGQLVFAQLIPMSFLSLIGGSLADSMSKRTLLTITQVWQMVCTLVLAALLIDNTIDTNLLLAIVFITGLGQGLYAPVFGSTLPTLVRRENLSAAVSLNSVQVNGARVIGPAIGGFLVSQFGFALVFFINGISYLFVIGAVLATTFPAASATSRSVKERILGGFIIARRAPQVGRPLIIMSLFAFLCLPFIGQLPGIAEDRLGIDAESTTYGLFYAAFGVGALLGALLVGTLLLKAPKPLVARLTLGLFAVSLAWFSTIREIELAYVAVFLVGLFYFALPTTLNTIWQQHVDDSIRGRVSALWVLAFGGTVPITNLLAGNAVAAVGLQPVLLFGALAAAVLALLVRIPTGDVVGEEILVGPNTR